MTRPIIAATSTHAINAVLASARQAIDIVCDRWSLILILAFFFGQKRFNDLMAYTGMASRLLASRLQALEEAGVITKMPYTMRPLRHEYHLTNMGTELFDIIVHMARWELAWMTDTSAVHSLVTRLCADVPDMEIRCRACGSQMTARHIELKVSRAQLQKVPAKQARHRRSTVSYDGAQDAPQLLGPSLDIFGDKWGIEILLCAFFRIHRFNDFRACIGISANILSDRLSRLVAEGLLDRGRDDSVQSGYWLTPKGLDVYAIMVAVHEWADKWVRARYLSPVRMIHRACGAPFLPMPLCARAEPLRPVESS